ncbi:MAG: squalene/phytoene synthase family protein [Parvularculaceae bacterium]
MAAQAGSADDAAYCETLVRQADEDRWLSIHYAKEPLRRRLMALAAFGVELKRIPDAVSEAPLGEIRLQWWRDALDELRAGKSPRAHPVVAEIAAAGLYSPEFAALIETAIDARARPLYDLTFASLEVLEAWLGEAEASLDRIAVMLAGGDGDAAETGGRAFALARETPRLAPSLSDAAAGRAKALHKGASAELRALDASAAPSVLHLALTPLYAKRARAFPLAKRMRLFSAMLFGRF